MDSIQKLAHLKGDFPTSTIRIARASECKGECEDWRVRLHAVMSVHVIECSELLTSSEGGAFKSIVP